MSTTAFDPFGETFLADPYPEFARLRTAAPVFWSPVLQLLGGVPLRRLQARAARVHHVLGRQQPGPGDTAVRAGRGRARRGRVPVHPHAHQRRPARARAHPPDRLPRVHAAARRADGGVRPRHRAPRSSPTGSHEGRADIVAALTWELPAQVIFQVLGVPASDVASVKTGAANRLLFMFGRAGEDEQVEIAAGMAEFWRYCEALAEDRRAHPRDDFTSDLVHTPDRDGHPLTQQEVATILFGLLLAGHETTTNLLGHAVRRLLEHRESWDGAVRRPDADPRRGRGGAALRLLGDPLAAAHDPAGRALGRGAARRRRRARLHRRRQPRSRGVRRSRPLRHPAARGRRAPLVRPRPALLPRRAARAAGGPRRAGGAHRRAAEPAPRARPDLRVQPDHRLPRAERRAGRVGSRSGGWSGGAPS